MKLIYLAAPYSHPDHDVVLDRVEKIDKAAAAIFERGLWVFSPISHSHPIKMRSKDLNGDFNFWAEYDYRMLSACDELWVLMIDGWRESVGVTAEISFALRNKIRTLYFEISSTLNGKSYFTFKIA